MGTVMCHQLHQADDNPLLAVGQRHHRPCQFHGRGAGRAKCRAGRFGLCQPSLVLLNLGLAERMAQASLAERSQAQRLVNEHEMGELFKVIGLTTSADGVAQGFARGDRSHRL